MLCQNCHQNPATIHLTTSINGRQTSIDLCQNCYQKLKDQAGNYGRSSSMMQDPFGFGNLDDLFRAMSSDQQGAQRQGQVPPTQAAGGNGRNNGSNTILGQYGLDLTNEAQNGRIDPVIGRDKEIERVIEILNRRTKNNPVLIGEAGVGKTAVVEGLAQKIVDNDVPQKLQNKKVIRLDVVSLVQGTGIRGQFEERMKQLMDELKKEKNTILFIDEIHEIVGAGNAEGGMDAGNVLKPALARGELQLVGATTLNEYRTIEKDAALLVVYNRSKSMNLQLKKRSRSCKGSVANMKIIITLSFLKNLWKLQPLYQTVIFKTVSCLIKQLTSWMKPVQRKT
jgi:ATPases with chaperone activity, ATP-binding subunit